MNAFFSWPLLGNKPAPKHNGLKQPSFYLLVILWVSSQDWGQALRGILWLVSPRAPQAAAVTCQLTGSCTGKTGTGKRFKHPVVFFDHCFLGHVSVMSLPSILQ